jgi:hypothetical protein
VPLSEPDGNADLVPFALSEAKGLTAGRGFQTLRFAQGERISIYLTFPYAPRTFNNFAFSFTARSGRT